MKLLKPYTTINESVTLNKHVLCLCLKYKLVNIVLSSVFGVCGLQIKMNTMT